MTTFVIGIDPSSAIQSSRNCIGFCVFADGELIEAGEIDPDPLMGFTRVRRWIRDKIRMLRVKSAETPTVIVACESAFLKSNPAVFMGLIRVKAHIESVVLDEGEVYREISPLVSFQASTGLTQYPKNERGKRDGTRKPAIQMAVKARYHLPEDTSEHVADALAVAEAIIQQQKREEHS